MINPRRPHSSDRVGRKVRRSKPPRDTGGLFVTLATAAMLAITVAALYVGQEVLIPIALAVLLAFLLARPVGWLERRKLGRVPSVLIVVTLAFLAIGSIGYVVGQQVVTLASNLDHYQGEIERKGKSLRGTGSGWGFGKTLEKLSNDIQKASETPATAPTSAPTTAEGAVKQATGEISADPSKAAAREIVNGPPATAPSAPGLTPRNPLFVTQTNSSSPIQTLLAFISSVGGPLGTAGLVVVFVIFMLLEREALRDRFIAVISRGNYTVTTRAINDAAERISRYLLAQSIVNGSYGLIIGLGLFLIGFFFGHGQWFPSFVLWALLCAMLRFIPYVGPAVSSLFPIALALAVYPGFTVAIAVLSLFVIVELISNNVMEPWLYGASTGLSTVAILVAAVFWTWLWGSVGLLVATPLTVCLAVIGKYVKPLRFLHILLGDEDALPPSVAFYQRMLAGDQVDAARIVQRVEQTQGANRVADVVYLPALRMARRDRRHDALDAEDETRILDDTLAIARPAAEIPATPQAAPLVLAYPAHHRAEEVTLHVLAQSLAPLGVKTEVMSTRSLPADIETAVERDRPAFMVIAVLPPGGLVQAKFLCRRLRKKFPELPILVGLWGKMRDFDHILLVMRKAGATYVCTGIEQTAGQIGAMLPKPPAAAAVVETSPNPS